MFPIGGRNWHIDVETVQEANMKQPKEQNNAQPIKEGRLVNPIVDQDPPNIKTSEGERKNLSNHFNVLLLGSGITVTRFPFTLIKSDLTVDKSFMDDTSLSEFLYNCLKSFKQRDFLSKAHFTKNSISVAIG